MPGIDVIIPTYKPNKEFIRLIEGLQTQTVVPNKIILMNTEKELITPFLKESGILRKYHNIEIHHILREEFDHGRTRHEGVQYSYLPYFLCMTQDALPQNEYLIEKLLKAMDQEKVAVAYARQLPRPESNILEEYTRYFNYPEKSRVKSAKDLSELGIKTYFCSNVCAIYDRQIYDRLGGFIRHTIFNEDMIYAATAIKAGLRVAYQADARVIHSHHYTGRQQFSRNFDLGVSQADHPEVFQGIPSEKEGKRLVAQMLRVLWEKRKLLWIVPFVYQTGCKLIGYRLGRAYKKLPKAVIRASSMNGNYWKF